MQVVMMDPARLTPYENNPRDNDASVPRVMASIKEFGFKQPIVVDRDMTVIVGHTRLKAALELGLKEVPVIVADDLDEDQAKAYRLADNKAGEESEWILPMLEMELSEIEMDMEPFGFGEGVDFSDLESMMGEKDDAYNEFTDKFKPKHTTDDCFTPPEVYEVVSQWVAERYGHKGKIVRPFYPGGDFESFQYPEGCLVLDNPPFSIMKRIVTFYAEKGVDFFLFADARTVGWYFEPCNVVLCGANIVYENGADVNTAFVTSLGDAKITVSADLHDRLDEAQPSEAADLKAYAFPDNLVTSMTLGRLARYGAEFVIENIAPIKKFDDGNEVFGGGALISDYKAEKVKAEKVKAEKVKIPVELSARERAIVERLNASEVVG